MTKKHFEQAAAIARAANTGHRFPIAQAFADLFAQYNPRFDRARFYQACGL